MRVSDERSPRVMGAASPDRCSNTSSFAAGPQIGRGTFAGKPLDNANASLLYRKRMLRVLARRALEDTASPLR